LRWLKAINVVECWSEALVDDDLALHCFSIGRLDRCAGSASMWRPDDTDRSHDDLWMRAAHGFWKTRKVW